MVKTYLRYAGRRCFGVINAPDCNVVVGSQGAIAVCGALTDIVVWHLRRGTKLRTFTTEEIVDSSVTCVALNPAGTRVAAGYTDGTVRIWKLDDLDITTGRHGAGTGLLCSLTGHKSRVACVKFNETGSLLMSGGADTDVVVWDVVGQAGLYRLRGHRDQVTDAVFFGDSKRLVTCSKDTFLKVWDLETQHCVQTCVGHRTEVWSLDMNEAQTRLVTGSGDSQIRVWRVSVDGTLQAQQVAAPVSDAAATGAGGGAGAGAGAGAPAGSALSTGKDAALSAAQSAAVADKAHLELIGSLHRTTNQRAQTVRFSTDGSLMLCQGVGKAVEVFRTRSDEGAKKKFNRRKKRAREKARSTQAALAKLKSEGASTAVIEQAEVAAANAAAAVEAVAPVPTDEFELVTVIRTSHKARSAAFCVDGVRAANGVVRVLVAAHSNLMEVFGVEVGAAAAGASPFSKAAALTLPGHRSAVRALTLSADGTMILSVAKHSAKVWNAATGQCIRTMATGFGLCCAFDPAGRYGIVGTKDGHLQLFDLSSSDMVEDHEAHEGALWTLAVRPDGKGLVTGSADKSVKFWNFDLVETGEDGEPITPRLGVVHTRTLKMSDDVLCVRYSCTKDPTRLLLAVALLDCTVKVFYEDTLKFFLSLYGHRLPVMSMDISSDNTLLVTASADKNVKLWGLDFGDCHKSLFAHTDSVMSVAFVPNTHLFFSAGKDGVVNYWDGDRFELVSTLNGHRGEVWSVAVSHDGALLASGSHDRSIRVWERTDEQVFLEEEKEKRLEEMFEKEASNPRADAAANAGLPESGRAGTRTAVTVKAADAILEALALAREEMAKWKEYVEDLTDAEAGLSPEQVAERKAAAAEGKPVASLVPVPQHNPLLLGLTPTRYLLRELQDVRPADLEEAMLALPFSAARELLKFLLHWVRKSLAPELTTKCIMFLVKLHHNQLVADESLKGMLVALTSFTQGCVEAHRDMVGFNRAGLRLLAARVAGDGNGGDFFGEKAEVQEESTVKHGRGKRRRYQLF